MSSEAGKFKPPDVQKEAAQAMLDALIRWAETLKPLRAESSQPAPAS